MLTLRRPVQSPEHPDHAIGPAPWIVVPPPGPMALWATARDRRVHHAASAGACPLVVRRAKGSVVEDVDGNRYLDFTGSLTDSPVGHAHPHVVQAIAQQTERLAAASETAFDRDPAAVLARRVAGLVPGEVAKRVLLTCGAAEAVAAAVQLMQKRTGRDRVVMFRGASHGQVAGLLAGVSRQRGQSRSGVGVDYLRYGNLAVVAERLTRSAATARRVAAIVVEPMQSEAGCVVPPSDFLVGLRRLCDEHGIGLVVDETHTGLGRTGKMFACEHTGVVPDVLITACGGGTGMQVSVLVAPDSMLDALWQPAGSSFAGHPIVCAAALATIEVLEDHLIGHAAEVAPIASGRMERIAHRQGCIGSPRGMGLMLAVDVVKTRPSQVSARKLRDRIIEEAFSRGLLLAPLGERGIRFHPALCINRVQIEVGLDVFEEAVATVSA